MMHGEIYTEKEKVNSMTKDDVLARMEEFNQLTFGNKIEDKVVCSDGKKLRSISWPFVWEVIVDADPFATFKVHKNNDPKHGTTNFFRGPNGTAFVEIELTIFGITRGMQLPVMTRDCQHAAVGPQIDSYTVNTAIMRCLVKCAALFKIGLFIYQGKKAPEDHCDVDYDPNMHSVNHQQPQQLYTSNMSQQQSYNNNWEYFY